MNYSAQQPRDGNQMRKRIVDAAVDLFDKGGAKAVSMRKIAERIDYSPAALYLYFQGKNDILLALCRRGFELLHERMLAASGISQPKERLMALCRTYLDFASQQPHYHSLMIFSPDVEIPQAVGGYEGTKAQATFRLMLEAMTECMEQGLVQGKEPVAAAWTVLMALQGLAAALSGKRLVLLTEEQRTALPDVMLQFLLR